MNSITMGDRRGVRPSMIPYNHRYRRLVLSAIRLMCRFLQLQETFTPETVIIMPKNGYLRHFWRSEKDQRPRIMQSWKMKIFSLRLLWQ